MRKFVRAAIVVCLSVAAISAVLFGSLSLRTWYRIALALLVKRGLPQALSRDASALPRYGESVALHAEIES
jgi:hypothetical protein